MAGSAQRPASSSDPTVIWEAQPRQAAFISCPADDVGFGGARGGGKSDAVMGDWLSHEDQYAQHAIGMAFRRELTQLKELIERCRQVLPLLGHKWHEQDKMFRGPNGGRLRFSYLENDSDADAYQGHSYTRLYPEEMGTFPSEAPINKLQATLRSGNGVPCQMKGTCNPGGPGHQWVRARYKLDEKPNGMEVYRHEFINPFTKEKLEKTRVFVPSKVTDNKYLGTDYIANLAQVGSEQLVRAWLSGDWSVVEGAFFDCWSTMRHIVRPFEIPKPWVRIRSGDWGYAKPFSIGWWAVVPEPTVVYGLHLPRGCMVRYREWYGRKGPNEGLRLDAEEVAAGIKEREAGEKIDRAVLDPSAFAQNGGPSLAERMYTSHRVGWHPADNTRVAQRGAISGWDAMRGRLKGDDDGHPMIVTFATCLDSIRTIPFLQHDSLRPEDIDTDAEDHCFAAGTMIATDSGPVAVESLVVGKHRVWSAGGWRSDYWPRMTSLHADVVRLKFSDGADIVCTPGHKFMDFTGEWRYAKDLQGVEVSCDQSFLARHSKSLTASAITYAASTFRSAANAFTARFGRKATGQSPGARTSTIKMVIVPTIRPKIWNCYLLGRTWAGLTALKAACAAVSALSVQELLLFRGMVASLGGSGTRSILSGTSGQSLPKPLARLANNAASNTKFLKSALNSASIAEITVKPVRCVSVEPAGNRAVYCIDEPETRAFTLTNGLIVHNCADEWRYACNSRPWVRAAPTIQKPKTIQTATLDDLWKANKRSTETRI